MRFFHLVVAFVVSVIALTVLATVFQSVFVLLGLKDIGASIDLPNALSMISADILGLGPLYGVFIAIGSLVAFLAAALVNRLIGGLRTSVYALAGAVMVLTMLLLMQNVFFGVQLIAGARSLPGFVFQMLAGLIAGWCFAQLTAKPTDQP